EMTEYIAPSLSLPLGGGTCLSQIFFQQFLLCKSIACHIADCNSFRKCCTQRGVFIQPSVYKNQFHRIFVNGNFIEIYIERMHFIMYRREISRKYFSCIRVFIFFVLSRGDSLIQKFLKRLFSFFFQPIRFRSKSFCKKRMKLPFQLRGNYFFIFYCCYHTAV